MCPVPPGLAFVVDEWPFFSKVVNQKRGKIFPHFSRPRFSKNGRSCLGLFTLFHALFTLFHVKNRFFTLKNRFFNLFTLSEMDQTDAEKRASRARFSLPRIKKEVTSSVRSLSIQARTFRD